MCGPPCAGKTTHVHHHAHPGDLIVCHDQLARAAGSTRRHSHAPHHHDAAAHAYDQAIHQLPTEATAWVIRCAPTADERHQLATITGAEQVIVLMPPMAVTLARAGHDHRSRRTYGVIRAWYRSYTQRDGDQVIGSTGTRPTVVAQRHTDRRPRW